MAIGAAGTSWSPNGTKILTVTGIGLITDAKGTIYESEWQLSQHMALMSFQSTQDGPTGGQEDDAMSVDFNTCD